MAEDQGKEEEKFDFTSEGEGYISLDAAIVNARRLVRQDEQHYLSRTGWDEIVWSTSESEAGDAIIKVVLQFRRPDRGLPEEESGLEEFLFDYNGELQDRQVLFWPDNANEPTVKEYQPSVSPSSIHIATPNAIQWGSKGSKDLEFNHPIGVSVASDGSVYVADNLNNRVQKFTSEGIFVTKWGQWGADSGAVWSPHGIAVASDGSLYVADTRNHRIQKFTSSGEFVFK